MKRSPLFFTLLLIVAACAPPSAQNADNYHDGPGWYLINGSYVGDKVSTNWMPDAASIYLGPDEVNEPLLSLVMQIELHEMRIDVTQATLTTSNVKVGTGPEIDGRSYEGTGVIHTFTIGRNYITGSLELDMERLLFWPEDQPESIRVEGIFLAVAGGPIPAGSSSSYITPPPGAPPGTPPTGAPGSTGDGAGNNPPTSSPQPGAPGTGAPPGSGSSPSATSPTGGGLVGEPGRLPMTGRVTIGGQVTEVGLTFCLNEGGAFFAEGMSSDGSSVRAGLLESEANPDAPYIWVFGSGGEWLTGKMATDRGAAGAEMTDVSIDGLVGTGRAVFARADDLTLVDGDYVFNCNPN
jgi:hypothetical protein